MLAWTVAIYHLWADRNTRVHDGKVCTEEYVIQRVNFYFRGRLCRCMNFFLKKKHHLKQAALGEFLFLICECRVVRDIMKQPRGRN